MSITEYENDETTDINSDINKTDKVTIFMNTTESFNILNDLSKW